MKRDWLKAVAGIVLVLGLIGLFLWENHKVNAVLAKLTPAESARYHRLCQLEPGDVVFLDLGRGTGTFIVDGLDDARRFHLHELSTVYFEGAHRRSLFIEPIPTLRNFADTLRQVRGVLKADEEGYQDEVVWAAYNG